MVFVVVKRNIVAFVVLGSLSSKSFFLGVLAKGFDGAFARDDDVPLCVLWVLLVFWDVMYFRMC